MRLGPGLAFALALTSTPAWADGTRIDLLLHNNTNQPVSFTISDRGNNCYDNSTPGVTKLGSTVGPIEPNGYHHMKLWRIQGHDCDGEQGRFTLYVEGQSEEQQFSYDNDGGIMLTNWPTSYTGRLSSKDEKTGAYEWSYDQKPRYVVQTRVLYIGLRDTLSPQGKQMTLLQSYGATRDDKRNVEAWPRTSTDPSWRWIQEFIQPDPSWDGAMRERRKHAFFLINMKSGLKLTQDSSDSRSNVSTWGDIDDVERQMWREVRATEASHGGRQHGFLLQNVGSGEYLVLENGGKGDGSNEVYVAPGRTFAHSEAIWDTYLNYSEANDQLFANEADLARLKLVKVKAISTSTGKDGATDVLFMAIDFAVETGIGFATGGTSLLGQVASKEALKATFKSGLKAGAGMMRANAAKFVTKEALKKELRKKALSTAAKKAALMAANGAAGNALMGDGAPMVAHIPQGDCMLPTMPEHFDTGQYDAAGTFSELAFDKIYGESPDQLEILVNNVSVWPNGGRDGRDIKSGQTLQVGTEVVFERQRGVAIQLREADYGSDDDSLGWFVLDTRDLRELEEHYGVFIGNKDEKSLYELSFTVEPFTPFPQGKGYMGYVEYEGEVLSVDGSGATIRKNSGGRETLTVSNEVLRKAKMDRSIAPGQTVDFIVNGGLPYTDIRSIWYDVVLGGTVTQVEEIPNGEEILRMAHVQLDGGTKTYLIRPSTLASWGLTDTIRAGQKISFMPQEGVFGRYITRICSLE